MSVGPPVVRNRPKLFTALTWLLAGGTLIYIYWIIGGSGQAWNVACEWR